MFHASLESIILGIVVFSVLVAGLDFVKRWLGQRKTDAIRSPAPAEPELKAAVPQIAPVVEARTVAYVGGITGLPLTFRAMPNLPLAGFLALPKPKPGVPQSRTIAGSSGICALAGTDS